MKTCSKCKKQLALNEFQKCKATKDGLRLWCRSCRYTFEYRARKDRDKPAYLAKQRLVTRKYRLSDPSRRYKQWLKSLYGITIEELNNQSKEQGHVCAICGKAQNNRKLVVDHNHATGQVRGLLCINCNHGLGSFLDSIKIMKEAMEYIKTNGRWVGEK